jgi:CheY-like chemotaxis protein
MLKERFRILVVEDEENTRVALAELLRLDGFEVVTANNGEDGYEKALWCEPDVIITDLVMPVLDGLEMCHRIRSEANQVSTVPILALSGNMNEYHLTSRLNSGINRFVRKPISDYRSLADTIRSLLTSKRSVVPVV